MIRVRIISVGKTKERWLEDALAIYVQRLRTTMELETVWAKDDTHLLRLVAKEKQVLCLDPKGETLSSEAFSKRVFQELEQGGSRLAFVIGGPEGLPAELRQRSALSLSTLTLTHQMVRLLLVEQLYRAVEIEKGSGYHK
jgi:23S rRNA (pseudouridine1915-N3)-methyltransferase